MKSIKALFTAALLAVSTSVWAQSANTGVSSSDNEGWKTFYLQWNPSTLSPSGGESSSFTGLSLGINNATSLTSSIPLYLEYGIGLQYSFKSETEGSFKTSFNLFSAKIPVSLVYDFQIPNTNIAIDPYVGVDLRGNVFGNIKYEYGGESQSYNLFSKDDMGDGNTWKRFQFGWHVGVNAKFNNKFLVGVSYGTDFTDISEKVKIHTASITLGFCY
jgi:opacity protein-like surface antigen